MVPLCSYARVQCLQGVAFASSLPSTAWKARLWAASSAAKHSRPAVLLPCWALGAEPEYLFVAFQTGAEGKFPTRCIAFMIPLC